MDAAVIDARKDAGIRWYRTTLLQGKLARSWDLWIRDTNVTIDSFTYLVASTWTRPGKVGLPISLHFSFIGLPGCPARYQFSAGSRRQTEVRVLVGSISDESVMLCSFKRRQRFRQSRGLKARTL